MTPSRRAFLGSVAAAVALAGCTGGPDDSNGGGQATDSPTATDPATEPATDSPTGSGADATVTVGPGGDLVFDPETLEVEVGTTVEFVWDSGGHTVTVESQPDGADWEGTGESVEDAGFTHTHTFDVEGRYDYFCVPHEGAGMVGAVVVGEASMGTETGTGTTATTTETDGGSGGGAYGDTY